MQTFLDQVFLDLSLIELTDCQFANMLAQGKLCVCVSGVCTLNLFD